MNLWARKVMLRNCKVNVVAFYSVVNYNKTTKVKEGFLMKLPDKIILLRKKNGWSQEDFAEKLNVSRQAISRWENGTALPDAQNVLQISKLFNVTTDYLLNDDYESDRDIPIVQTATQETEDLFSKKKQLHLISAIAFTISVLCSLMGVVSSVNHIQFRISCFALPLCAANAVAQFILFSKKR
jgi:transcriptional regulator with XRE-family HTH domain